MGLFAAISTDLLPHAYLGTLARAGVTESGERGALFSVGALLFLGPALFAGAALGTAGTIIGAALPAGAAALGAAAGTALPGILIPALGLQGTLALCGSCLAVAGALLVFFEEEAEWGRAVRGLSLLSISGLLLWRMEPWDRRLLTAAVAGNPALYLQRGEPRLLERVDHDRIVAYLDGAFHTAAVKIVEGQLPVLFLDGSVDPLEGLEARRAQRLTGHLPALLGPEGGRALVLGAGPPGTVEALRLHGTFTIDVAAGAAGVGRMTLEADRLPGDPPGPPAAPERGAAAPAPAAAEPATRVLDEDGIRALVADAAGYDLITAPPSASGSALIDLLDPHALAMMRDHLRPGGIVCLPVTLRGLSRPGVEAAIDLFRHVFPSGSAWSAGSDLLLLGTAAVPGIDAGRVLPRARRPGVAEDLAAIGLEDALKVLSLRLFPLTAGAGAGPPPAWSGGGSPRLLEASAAEGRLRSQLAENLRAIASRAAREEVTVRFPDGWSPEARSAAGARLALLRDARTKVLLAHAALSAGDAPEALRQAKAALDLDPGNFAARSFGGRALASMAEASLARGQRGVAAGAYQDALDIDPASIEALTALSWIRHEQGSRESAETLARKAIEVAPRTALLRYRLGVLRLEAGDLQEAEANLLLSHDLDPRQPEPLVALGDIERRRGHATQAMEMYRRALALGARETETRTALASLHLDAGRLDDAGREIEAALRAKPGDPDALLTRAILRARRGEKDAARRDLLAAVTTGGSLYRARAMARPELRRLLDGEEREGGAR
jgi:tetratricopeptide (TPR) repeat protein